MELEIRVGARKEEMRDSERRLETILALPELTVLPCEEANKKDI